MKTVAITGASGFVGGRLAHYLAERGYKVLAFGRRKSTNLPSSIKYISWDITTGPLNLDIDYPLDAAVHCAGSVTDWGQYASLYQTNVIGTRHVLQTFRNATQFIHISTASVYDPTTPKDRVKEAAPYAARYLNAYGLTKQQAEQVVIESSYPSRIIVRPHIIYGPGDTTLLPRLLKARKFGRFVVIGDGQNHISLTYIDNLCYGVELILQQQINGFEVFNLADARIDSLNQIVLAFLKAFNFDAKLLHLNKNLAQWVGSSLEKLYQILHLPFPPLLTPYIVSQMANEYTLDISKAQQKLGYKPLYDYEQGFAMLAPKLS